MRQTLLERSKQISAKILEARTLVAEINGLLFKTDGTIPKIEDCTKTYNAELEDQVNSATELVVSVKELAKYVWNGDLDSMPALSSEHEDLNTEPAPGELKAKTIVLESILKTAKELLRLTKNELFADSDSEIGEERAPNLYTYDDELNEINILLSFIFYEANEILNFIRPEPESASINEN